MGWVAVIPVLIGGAIGGALPDIDIEGSSTEKLGSKTAAVANKVIGKVGSAGMWIQRAFRVVGHAFDLIFLKPLGRLWRFLSEHVFGRIYLILYRFGSFGKDKKTLGELLHWNGDSTPWAHRGGITHSFSFMFTSCIILVPLSFVFQSPELLIGAELGILSHLFADSMCKSGVKFFFPFQPRIGFDNENGSGRGRDVRILPKGMQVSTGKDRITDAELDVMPEGKAKKERKLRRREKMWQYIFRATAVVSVTLLVVGFAGRAGGIAFSSPATGGKPVAEIVLPFLGGDKAPGITFSDGAGADADDSLAVAGGNAGAGADGGTGTGANGNDALTQTGAGNGASDANNAEDGVNNDAASNASTDGGTMTQAQGSQGDDAADGSQQQPQFDVATVGGTIAGASIVPIDADAFGTKPEIVGPRSLTNADVSIRELPKGIMKMPDESLWVIGVGPVTRENLDETGGRWVFTQQEKDALLRAAEGARAGGIPESLSQIVQAGESVIKDAVETGAQTVQNGADAAKDSGEGAAGWLSGITGTGSGNGSSGGSGYSGGFLGLTPWTSS